MTIFWYQFVGFQWCNPTKTITTPKINIEPENRKLEDDFPVFSHKKPRLDVFLSRTLRQALAAGEVFGSLWETCVSLFGPGNLDVFHGGGGGNVEIHTT